MSIEAEDNSGTLDFFSEVTKYFMDFLETDFHKRRLPRRSIKARNSDNLLVGVSLKKYESFNREIQKCISDGFSNSKNLRVKKGQFKAVIPKNILELITLQISKISNLDFQNLIESIALRIEQEAILNKDDFEFALASSLDSANANFYNEMIHPFISNLEKPLSNRELGDKDDIFMLEQELVEIFVQQVTNKISEILRRLIVGEQVNVAQELSTIITLGDLQNGLTVHFENLQVSDLFYEIHELANNKMILDKQEFYLYFGDISFQSYKYPLFYIPLEIKPDKDSFDISFDSQLYVNKKALDFISQEYNRLKGTHGNLKLDEGRIIYLSQIENGLLDLLNNLTIEIENFFELRGSISFGTSYESTARGADVSMTNSFHFGLFDKSDEALVNDYEEILSELSMKEGDLAETFQQLLSDFLLNNPIPVGPEVEEEWYETDISDKLVISSPIPLNSEQLQILNAIKKPNSKYLVVEGPPGTGKSHTITAIIFDAILNEKSTLVLSDKKEALDVVEKNIVETMNKVRFDQNFQNPILRLGKTGNTYSQILSKSSITDMKTHFYASRKEFETFDDQLDEAIESLKVDIKEELNDYEAIDLEDIEELSNLESSLSSSKFIFDEPELMGMENGALCFDAIRSGISQFRDLQSNPQLVEIGFMTGLSESKITDYPILVSRLNSALEILEKLRKEIPADLSALRNFKELKLSQIQVLKAYLDSYFKCNKPIIGYAFSKGKLAELDSRFIHSFGYQGPLPSRNLIQMQTIYKFMLEMNSLIASQRNYEESAENLAALIKHLVSSPVTLDWYQKNKESLENIAESVEQAPFFPKTMKKLGLDLQVLTSINQSKLFTCDQNLLDLQIKLIALRQSIQAEFANISEVNYSIRKNLIERLMIAKVTNELDGRVINFYENHRNDAETLKKIIKSKQKFPTSQFSQLSEAFPCILAGIRDFAEYIPLHNQMFDLLIIDEASQVSLAQAFPALIRAKKVLILGDRKQFSNIKANQARSDTNREYLSRLEASFKANVSTNPSQLIRLGKFNIKTSVLEFFEFISNYNIQLRKHFRGYKEIISYSNKYFYRNSLQVMKIRAKHIDEVIKFDFVEPNHSDEIQPNTNLAEVKRIIFHLRNDIVAGKTPSIGIITPHTNQQKLLQDEISKLPENEMLFNDFKLKIMTFDTCQGEERDIIYYSMVASRFSDKLWGIFIKDLNNVDIEEDGQIKAQRLNVGFSRAKECVHFILSKPLEEFSGSIGEALRHFAFVLSEGLKERLPEETDQTSAMESEVLHWFYQTDFWNRNRSRITFIPQFEVGKYLKQLDPTYTHPLYKVDFLIALKESESKETKIILEYDGFAEHFRDHANVNKYNYQVYMSEGDIYRQKVLESYGYRFIRLNKFNTGADPIDTLNTKLQSMFSEHEAPNLFFRRMQKTIVNLQNGDERQCPRCEKVRPLKDFRDTSLVSGYGRACTTCKSSNGRYSPRKTSSGVCKRCGSPLVMRTGRFGNYFVCTRYPQCKR